MFIIPYQCWISSVLLVIKGKALVTGVSLLTQKHLSSKVIGVPLHSLWHTCLCRSQPYQCFPLHILVLCDSTHSISPSAFAELRFFICIIILTQPLGCLPPSRFSLGLVSLPTFQSCSQSLVGYLEDFPSSSVGF